MMTSHPLVICRLSRDAAEVLSQIDLESNTPPWGKEIFVTESLQEHSRIYGARIAGEVVGFLVVHVVLDQAHIINFAVRADLRSRGIGKGLLVHILREFYAEGVLRITLEVRTSNQAAQALYRSLGFRAAGLRERYYTDNLEDALILGLDIRDFTEQYGIEQGQISFVSREELEREC